MKNFFKLLPLLLFSILLVNCGGGGDGSSSDLSSVATELILVEDGGELVLAGGSILSIPENALPDDTTITFREITNEETPNAKVFVFEPEGLIFNEPAILKFPAKDFEDSDTVEAIILSSSISGYEDGDEYVQAEELSLSLNHENYYETELNHFSSVTAIGIEVVNVVFDLPSKYLLPGDVEYNLNSFNRWLTGHGRLFLGFGDELGMDITQGSIPSTNSEVPIFHLSEDEMASVQEALETLEKDDYSANDTMIQASMFETGYWGEDSGVFMEANAAYRTKREEDLYMGAKRIKSLSWEDRINIAKFAIDKDGYAYGVIGNSQSSSEYSCVGLIESAYNSIGKA